MVTVVNYGGGVNSTALLCEAIKRKIPVDLIVFADTGSERPETYQYIKIFNDHLIKNNYPEINIVKWIRVLGEQKGQFIPLHIWCEQEKTVPSRAFGYSGCTSKWKQQPADKFVKKHPLIQQAHQDKQVVERWIGFDADEPERAQRMFDKNPEPELWKWRAPLVEWDLGRDECLKVIEGAGLQSPGKSACWMCPSSKKKDIDQLAKDHPELLKRALLMEKAAKESGNLASRNGLGGRLNWNEYVINGLGIDPDDLPCGCYDGTDD